MKIETSDKLREIACSELSCTSVGFDSIITEVKRLESIAYNAANLAGEVGPGYSGHADTLIEMFAEDEE